MNPPATSAPQAPGIPTAPGEPTRWRDWLRWAGLLVQALYRDATEGQLSLQAMSLVYTTLLSLVPLLAVSFSILKGFGAHDTLGPLLLHALEPLGDQAPEIARTILGFVDNIQVGVLGTLGLAILIYVVISMVQKIEQVFNHTWRTRETRPLVQRISQYLSLLLIAPVLLFTLVSLSSSARGMAPIESVLAITPMGNLIEAGGSLVPPLALLVAFMALYILIPDTRVRLSSASIGALVAVLLWETVGWIFAHFMVSSTEYAAIYSGLAILILFMIWLYIAWLIVLIGASVAFYHQYPEYLSIRTPELRLSNRLRERLALLVGAHCARHYLNGQGPWNGACLATALGLPRGDLQGVLDALEQEGFLLSTSGDPSGYVPAKPPDRIGVKALLDAVRTSEEREGGYSGTATEMGLAEVERQVDSAVTQALGAMTLGDLAAALRDPPPQADSDG